MGDELNRGPFTRDQALDAGMTSKQLHQATQAGWLRHPVRGVYVPASLPDTLEIRCATLALAIPADAFVCDHTAAWLHAGDRALLPGDHLVVPEVSCFRPMSGYRLRRDEIRSGEREVSAHDIMDIGSLRATTPLRTALDLGRLSRNNDARLHGMDTMLSLGTFAPEELLGELDRFKGQRGVVGLRALAPLADGGSQSYGESALRLRWHGAHLPRPVTQHPAPGPLGENYLLDLALPELCFSREYDGEEFHSTEDQRAHDTARRLWLRRRGWDIEAFRKEHVFGRAQTVEHQLRAAYDDVLRSLRGRRYFS